MAQQAAAPIKKRGHMSGLAERLGGDGKIQYETSKLTDKSKSRPYEPSFVHLSIAVVIISCISEAAYSFGSIILIIGLILSAIYSIRARPHDNIPMGGGYIPFFGHMFNVFKHWHDFYDEEHRTFSTLPPERAYYSTSIPLGKNFIFLVDPKLIDYLFRLKFGDADKGEEIRTVLEPMFGKGIFVSDGAIWKKHRSIASRMFTLRALRDYMFTVFMDTTTVFLDKCVEIQDPDRGVDIYDMFNRLTLEAFTQVAFGVPLGTIACAPEEVKFSTSFDEGFQICTKRFFDVTWPIQKFLNFGREQKLKGHLKVINEFATNIIQKKKAEFKTKFGNKGKEKGRLREKYDLMSLFLKDDGKVSDKELRDVALNFIIAGRDTTAQLLSWFCYLVTQSENRWVEEKIRAEIAEHITGDLEQIDYAAINKCEYLESAFLETLRLRPSVPHLVRYAKIDITLPNGDVIRKGDGIVVPTYAMGRMPWIWNDPLKFNPDRFQDENQKYTPSQYPAFNIPPRLCLGKHVALLEAKIAIIRLFQKYEMEAVQDQDVAYEFSVTNQMRNGFRVKLKPRK